MAVLSARHECRTMCSMMTMCFKWTTSSSLVCMYASVCVQWMETNKLSRRRTSTLDGNERMSDSPPAWFLQRHCSWLYSTILSPQPTVLINCNAHKDASYTETNTRCARRVHLNNALQQLAARASRLSTPSHERSASVQLASVHHFGNAMYRREDHNVQSSRQRDAGDKHRHAANRQTPIDRHGPISCPCVVKV